MNSTIHPSLRREKKKLGRHSSGVTKSGPLLQPWVPGAVAEYHLLRQRFDRHLMTKADFQKKANKMIHLDRDGVQWRIDPLSGRWSYQEGQHWILTCYPRNLNDDHPKISLASHLPDPEPEPEMPSAAFSGGEEEYEEEERRSYFWDIIFLLLLLVVLGWMIW